MSTPIVPTMHRQLILAKPPEGYEPTNCIVVARDPKVSSPRLIQMWLKPEDVKDSKGKEVWCYVPAVLLV